MKPLMKIAIAIAAALIVLGIIGSIAARLVDFPFTSLRPLSFLIYMLGGFLATRRASLKAGIGMGALAGAVDATVVLAIFQLIGPPAVSAFPPLVACGLVMRLCLYCLVGAALGLCGGLLARLTGRLTRRQSGASGSSEKAG